MKSDALNIGFWFVAAGMLLALVLTTCFFIWLYSRANDRRCANSNDKDLG